MIRCLDEDDELLRDGVVVDELPGSVVITVKGGEV